MSLPFRSFVLLLLGLISLSCAISTPKCTAQQQASIKTVDFNRDVRPILAQYCFRCHGTDESSREAELRLDQHEFAIAKADSGKPAIVPGSPETSELVHRIFSDDDSNRMPPPSTKTVMPESAKQILKSWIQAGAQYQQHWAYIAPDATKIDQQLKQRSAEEQKLHPIDFFVRRKLAEAGLQPSPTADRYTLVRRLYLDLIGLPPTAHEADEFVRDSSADAYDRLVEKLLNSPQYGERWARRWLDLARYADTNGFEKDRPRTIWPYRDWVIRALNEDLPYDQFSIKQLAGDLLEQPTPDDLIATGFHRNTMLNEEGGIDPLEYRFYSMVDRVGVTGTTWLGLTLNCAQCHSHKYDPIPHADFYRLMALLNNADEPTYYIPPKNAEKLVAEHQQKVAKLTSELWEKFPGGPNACEAAFEQWLNSQAKKNSQWQVVKPTKLATNLPHLVQQSDGFILGSGDISKSDVYDLTLKAPVRDVRAIRIEVASHPSLPNGGPGLTNYEGPIGGFFLSELQAFQNDQRLQFSKALATNDAEEDQINDASGGNKKAKPKNKDKQAKKNNASAALDGEMSSGWQVLGGHDVVHSAVFYFSQPIDLEAGINLKMLFEKHFACSLGNFRISITTSDDAQPTSLSAQFDAALRKLADQPNNPAMWKLMDKKQLAELQQVFLEDCSELDEQSQPLAELRRRPPRGQATLVMRERPADNPRATHRYHRGEYLQPREAVQPGVPQLFKQLPADGNRLQFAKWLFSPDHPLTARVTVNRQWQAFFGNGIVKSLDDFGYQSQPPSNQDLLDFLAIEFTRQNWSMKKLHKLIVTSQTYQQSSRVTSDLATRDPDNLLLSRGARFRLEAEIIRDSALKAAGVLSTKMGGPGVYPPQPASVTTEGTYGRIEWKTSEGEDRYRRSIYTFVKRTAPFAMATTFDAPSGESCLAKRDVSNSPLQALTLLNDQMFFEAADALAKAVMDQSETDSTRIENIFRRCLTRPPATDELERLQKFVDLQRDRKIDEAKVWIMLSRAMMNLDEAITHP